MRAGKEAKGKHEIGLDDLVKMVEAARIGIQERGKAQLGDKTVLDALVPTVAALKAAAADGLPLGEALAKSLAAAEEGLKATIPMKSKIGRASWIADRTVGHQDPGATSFYLMWKSAIEYLTA
jgi:dihydroxyacetone kinase-like protein